MNLSKSGVSLSGGVRGARINVGARGTYVTLSTAGFQYRRKLDGPSAIKSGAAESRKPEKPAASDGAIYSASVASLQETSADEAMRDIDRRLSRINWFVAYVAAAACLVLIAGEASTAAQILTGVILAALAVPVFRWNDERRTARLLYNVDDPFLLERLALGCAAGEALGESARVWHIWWQRASGDWKRNAGASHLIQRTVVRARRGSLPHIESNIEPWSVPVGPQQLLFLPDRLLIREGRRFAAVPYEDLEVTATSTRFIEQERVPQDAEVVGTTWRYVNRSGEPDRRFNNNRQLNVARYGELVLESGSAVRVILQTSSVPAAERAAAAIAQLQRGGVRSADESRPRAQKGD